MSHPARRWLPVAVVIAALLVVGIAAQGAGVQWERAEPLGGVGEAQSQPPVMQQTEEPLPSETATALPDSGGTFPSWVTWLVLGLILGIPVLILLIYVTRRLIEWLVYAPPGDGRPEPEPQYLHRDLALVEDAVTAALAEMDLGTDPRAAIMACWLHFERAAETVGIERDPSDTPADLVTKLLVRHELDGAALSRLSAAYLRARYSPHDVGETDRDQARDALIALQTQLGVRGTR